jgi:hypothetical protein
MKWNKFLLKYITVLSITGSFVLSCGNNNKITLNADVGTSTSVKLGGVIKGLAANETVSVQYQDSGSIETFSGGAGDQPFVFSKSFTEGESFNVQVKQVNPAYVNCIASGNSGTIPSIDKLDVVITCNATAYTVGGTIGNLLGSGLVLKNTINGELYSINTGTLSYSFPTPLATGVGYNIIVNNQPSNLSQTCSVASGIGTTVSSNIINVNISCTTNQFTVSGIITNLAPTDTVKLRNNGVLASDQTLTGSVGFSFPAANDGTGYSITVVSTTGGTTGCTVTNGAGTIAGGPVSNITVTCVYPGSSTVSGAIAGLATGATLVLHNGVENLILTGNGAYSFTTIYANGVGYNVSITNPLNPSQTCTFDSANNTGFVPAIGVNITCVTNPFTIGGTVSGLGAGTVTLLNNGINSTPVIANGAFTFSTSINSGSVYNVTVASTTGGITCTVGSGLGVVVGSNITNVAVTCAAAATYTIGGVITGLPSPIGASTGITLKNNGVDTTAFMANGNFSFPTAMPNGSVYNVTIFSQPANPGETCSILNPSGTVNGTNVISVVVTCSTNTYTVGGNINWNAQTGSVTLQYNGSNNYTINSPTGVFTFPSSFNDLSSYNVSVLSTTGGITCTPGANMGAISASNVSNVTITCSATPLYTVGVNITGFTGTTNLMLKNNGIDYLAANTSGVHNFSIPLANSAGYSLAIVQQPASPNTTCSFTGSPAGTIAGANATIAMNCSINQYTVGGTVTGLLNTETVTLQNNGGNNKVVTGAGSQLYSAR